MNRKMFDCVGGGFVIAGLCFWAATARAQDPPSPDGVDVQMRGPVHEAFAEPAVRGPRPAPLVPKQPPDAIDELPPDQKPAGDNVQWIPGYWGWDQDRNDFLWISGLWRDVPPGRQWLPGHWVAAQDGWQWVPGYWADAEQTDAAFLPQPPDPVAEAPPPAPGANDLFVPGTWVFRDSRFLWRPGFWMPFRPGWVWAPAHYVWTPAGFVFIDGYWDFPLANRGLLFAPVVITPANLLRPGWVYQPFYAVNPNFLFGCLFVRPDWSHYYFGDYFGPAYARRGFLSWVDYRISRRFYDPLLNYYRWANRNNPVWAQQLAQVYVARRDGRIPPPPRTLAQAQALAVAGNLRSIANGVTLASVANIIPVAKVTQVSRTTGIAMRPVTPAQVQHARSVARQYRELTQQRTKIEAQVIVRGSPMARGPGPAASVRVAVPGLAAFPKATPSPGRNPPPAPRLPSVHPAVPGAPSLPPLRPPVEEAKLRTPPRLNPLAPTSPRPPVEEAKPRTPPRPNPAPDNRKPPAPPPRNDKNNKPPDKKN